MAARKLCHECLIWLSEAALYSRSCSSRPSAELHYLSSLHREIGCICIHALATLLEHGRAGISLKRHRRQNGQGLARRPRTEVRLLPHPNAERRSKGMNICREADALSKVYSASCLTRACLGWREAQVRVVRGDSGTSCGRHVFILAAGIIHTRTPRSISLHVAPRTSPDRAAPCGAP